jgi:hypothetical protein
MRRLRHVGLSESMHFIASQLGWHLEKTEWEIEPVIADQTIQTESLKILSGQVTRFVRPVRLGLKVKKIKLIFQASVGEPDS